MLASLPILRKPFPTLRTKKRGRLPSARGRRATTVAPERHGARPHRNCKLRSTQENPAAAGTHLASSSLQLIRPWKDMPDLALLS